MKRIEKHHARLQLLPHVTRTDWSFRRERIYGKTRADGVDARWFRCRDCKTDIVLEDGDWPTCSNCYGDDVVCIAARLWFFEGVPE